MENSKDSLDLADKYSFIYAAVGVHPSEVYDLCEADMERLYKMAQHEKAVAIGEIGFDYHYPDTNRELQKKWFERQMDLACELSMPVVIHTRDAISDTLDVLRKSKARGIVHCFSESAEIAREVVKMGYMIGIGGPLTFKNARHAVNVVREIPIEYIVTETDCPYLAPDGHRGERNDSSLMSLVCAKIAEIKGMDYDEVAEITYKNAERVYRIGNKL